MKALVDFITRYYYWVVFLLLEIVCVTLLLRWNAYQRSMWCSAMTEVVGYVHKTQADVLAYVSMSDANRMLTERNVVLEQRVERLTRLVTTLTHDTTYAERLIMETAADSARLIPALVVNANIGQRDNFIVIDRGERDGVRTEMGVVSGTGVVGIVYRTSPHFSVVMPVLHSKSSVSCRLRGADYFGYLQWGGGDLQTAVVNDIPRHAQVSPGDIVETSGFSAVFPAGLFVGRVAEVANSDDGLAYTLHVRLGVDFARLRDVVVIDDVRHTEIDSLRISP